MREIKFRIWDYDLKRFVEQEFNFLINSKGELFIFRNDKLTFFDKEPYEITQHTGLKDKNGKEIYEEDIVEFDDVFEDEYGEVCDGFNRAVVKFENGENTLTNFLDENSQTFESVEDRNTSFKTLIESIEAKVIGNIYENPELLEAKE